MRKKAILLPIAPHEHQCSGCGSVFTCVEPHHFHDRGKLVQCPPSYFVRTCSKAECAFKGFE
jgi:hypothetical protein